MNQIIVITGTSRGIGRKLAEYYLDAGNTVIGCSRGNSKIEEPKYCHYEIDVTDENQVISMIRDVRRKHGRIDALVNNAGIASMNHVLMTPYEAAKKIIATNFLGTFLFAREVSKIMMKKKYGRIVNFSTVAVPLRLEGEAIYASSKAAIVFFTEILSKEVAEFGITVNAIGPTPVATDLIKNVPESSIDNLVKRQTIQRFGKIGDIVNVVDFFINPESGFITGQVIYLGGVLD